MRNKPILTISRNILLLIICFLLFGCKADAQSDATRVATVNGYAITAREIKREMGRYRAETISSLVREYKISDMKGFWEKSYGNVTPLNVLINKGMDAMVFIKVQEELLNKYNLWPYRNYSAFVEDCFQVNKKRKLAEKEGRIIYGPVVFSEQAFFDYQFSNSLIRLKEKLIKEGRLTFNAEDLQAHFQKMKTTVYRSKEKVRFEDYEKQIQASYIEEAYAKLIIDLVKVSKVKINNSKLNQIQQNLVLN